MPSGIAGEADDVGKIASILQRAFAPTRRARVAARRRVGRRRRRCAQPALRKGLTLTRAGRRATLGGDRLRAFPPTPPSPACRPDRDVTYQVLITLNGDRFELDAPLSVQALLARLDIDPRRVAVE